MTVFITHCWKSSTRLRGSPDGRARSCLPAPAWCAVLARLLKLLALGLVLSGLGTARAQGTDIANLRAERSPEGVVLSAQVRFELPPAVDEALQKGIPLFFVADAVLLRERWYWTDQEVAGATRHMRLSYQPLTRRWRVVIGNSPIGQTGLALGQSFESRDEALAVVQRISGWRVAEPGELDNDQRYTLNLRFRLDTSQLPRPFQIGLVGQAEWNFTAARSLRLDPVR